MTKLEADKLSLTLGENGAVSSICSNGAELGSQAEQAFTIEILDKEGNALLLKSTDFKKNGNTYEDCEAVPGLNVKILWKAENGSLHCRPEITCVPPDMVISWFDGPQICYPLKKDIKMVQPFHDGVLISDNTLKTDPYRPIGFAKRGFAYGSFYPGRAQLQLMAFIQNGKGVYFAAHDPHGATKAMEYEVMEDKVRLSLQTFTGCDFGESYLPDWDYVISAFTGTWQDAAELYRNWLENAGLMPPEANFPDWMKDSPVVAIYPVRGHGLDTGEMEPNCYFPYTNALPYLRNMQEKLNSKIMPLIMHWEGTAPWAPPYVWPPYGGEKALADFRDALHAEGNPLGVYCSGTAWTCTSSIIKEYAPGCTPEQEKFMLRGPKGELEASICNGEDSQRLGYDLCMSEEEPRKIVMDEIMKMACFDIDYSQFYDQNHGGCVHNCYARDHHHPPVPGPWQCSMQKNILADIMKNIRKAGKSMILGCESAATDMYAEYLPLNDARASFVAFYGETIPLQQYVLHGTTSNFAGNQGGARWKCDFSKSPYSLNRRLAYAFHAGDLLSVTLKENGNAHWCWGLEWDIPGPPQEQFWKLMYNLNAMRKKYPQFLLHGRMLKDAIAVSGETVLEYDCEGQKMEMPAFYHTTWQAPDGSKALFAVNYLDRKQTLKIGDSFHELEPCSVLAMPLEN